MNIDKFEIHGLFDRHDVSLDIEEGRRIIIGPNGYGKTTILNCMYYFVSRQWQKLERIPFREASITIGSESIKVTHDQLRFLDKRGHRYMRRFYDLARHTDLLDQIRTSSSPSPSLIRHIARITNSTPHAAEQIYWASREEEPDLFSEHIQSINAFMREKFPHKFYYLPTYRRIEKDLSDIFPHLDSERLPSKFLRGDSERSIVEIIQFGMDDVESIFKDATSEARSYSHSELNNLAGRYLKEVILKSRRNYEDQPVDVVSDVEISLKKVNENVLSDGEKQRVLNLVKEIEQKESLSNDDSYVLSYVQLLNDVISNITKNDKKITNFVNNINQYLLPSKYLEFDDINYEISIIESKRENLLSLSSLSSGEKQIVSLFSHLFLQNEDPFYIFIDEPELSLSVPWQRNFLEDISRHSNCELLVSVTHSPFIWENSLENYATDIRQLIMGD
ncbi:AAA family ATPase [Hyphobacterium marinum]|uniref:AAA family ATPase n=1 Tax=Hyphobacterium marinum TaxID=3116574 RepID=A0ABU7M0T8_9PROT|nr:AAA family ATPase [Hyphobacterium sp. Y6023]MEE2567439.1 AAA family ATPase [Hyphobacterium sp. Y6023]